MNAFTVNNPINQSTHKRVSFGCPLLRNSHLSLGIRGKWVIKISPPTKLYRTLQNQGGLNLS